MKLKWIFLGLLYFGFTTFCKAQSSLDKKNIELFLPILKTLNPKKGEISVFLKNVKGVSVKVGMSINAYQRGIYSNDPDEITRDFRLIGSGRIQQISDTLIGCYIKFNHPEDSLSAGDVISFQAEIPNHQFESIFLKLAFQNKCLTDLSHNYFYSLQDLIFRDSPQLEDSILTVMLEDINTAYNAVKDNPAEIYKIPASSGRFKGKKLLESLAEMNKETLKIFLTYVVSYSNYIGQDHLLYSILATWLSYNSPYSSTEVREAILPVFRNKKVFEESVKNYALEIRKGGMSQVFGEEALKLSGSLNFSQAKELADFAQTLSVYTKDTSAHIFLHIVKSEISENEGMYSEALKEIDSALLLTQKFHHIDYEVLSLRKKALILSNLFKLAEAKVIIGKATRLLTQHSAEFEEIKLKEAEKSNLVVAATLENEEGDFASSFKKYQEAIRLNQEINTYASLEQNALFTHALGEILNSQGKPNEALIELNKAEEIYKRNRNKLETGKVQNEMAYSYSLAGNYKEALKYCMEAFENLEEEDLNKARYSKSLRGTIFWLMGNYDLAIQSHRESIALARISNNEEGQADSWKQIGDLFRLSGYKNKALQAYDSTLYFYKKINYSLGLAQVYNEKGAVYLNDENYKEAIIYFDSARGVSSKTTVEALYNLGAAWESINIKKATKYYTACQALSDSTQNIDYLFMANASLTKLAFRDHDITTAERYFKISEKIAAEINTPIYKARALSLKAFGYEYTIKLDSALYYYEKAAEMFKEVSMSQYFWQKMNISSLEMEMGNFKKSETLLIELESLARDNNDQIALGTVFSNLTFLYSLTGEFSKGNSCKDSSFSVFKNSGNHVRLAAAYNSAAVLMKNMGNFREAIHLGLLADSIYKRESLTSTRPVVLNNIGVTYYNQGDYRKALDYFWLSEQLEGNKEFNEENLLYKANIAECYYHLGKQDSALAIYLKAFPFARDKKLERIASGMALVLGNIYLATKEFDKAREHFQYARTFSENSGEKKKLIESLMYLGDLDLQKEDSAKAETWFRSAIDQLGNSNIPGGWEPFYKLGLIYYHKQQFDSCILYLRKASDLLQLASENIYGGEEARKIFNNDPRKQDLFSKITFAYFNVGNIKEAWSFANKSNIAGIKELSGSLTDQSGDAEVKEILAKLTIMQESKKALAASAAKQTGATQQAILKKIEILEKDYSNFLDDIKEKSPQLSPYFAQSNADDFYNYKGKLPEDVAVVLYITNDKTLMIFTLTNELLSVDTMNLDISPEVKTFISTVKKTGRGFGSLSTRSETVDEDDPLAKINFKDVSDKLYTILIGSIKEKIKTKTKLCIIPSGIFSNMPFQCLGEKRSDSSFHFLLDDYAIFYTNKLRPTDTTSMKDKHKDFYKSFAAFGVPDKTLRFNINEVKSIGKIIGADVSFIYTDKKATESLAKISLESKRYLHFATHGVLVYSAAFSESYLKFLPDEGSTEEGSGKLTIRKIKMLDIQDCDLVVLSACETGISQELVKGWNISPANAFLDRKVKSVIASLWKVDDEATSILMNHFYTNLNKNMEIAEALRLAQGSLSKNPKFEHPFYWGAFVLYGDWK